MRNGKQQGSTTARASIIKRLVVCFGSGVLDDGVCKAYWIQVWKLRFGFFVQPFVAMLDCGVRKCGNLGWMVSFGPFQVCYRRYA